MIELIPTVLDDRVLGMRIRGGIDRADLDTVAAAFEDKLERHARVRIYAEVEEVGGLTPAALLEDLRLSLRHFRDVEREAIVTDSGWLDLPAKAGNLLPGIEVRAFSWLDKGEALAWISDEEASPRAGA
jgi:hypothetical protein